MKLLEDSLAEAILTGQIKDGDTAIVDLDANNQVKVLPTQQRVLQYQTVG